MAPPAVRKPVPGVMRGHYEVGGAFKPGTTLTNAVPVVQKIPTAGATRVRGRWLSTIAGTLSFKWIRPDGETEYAANNPGDVVIVGGTENKFDVDPHFGEGLLQVTFTPGATGVLTYFDVCEI